MGRLKDSLTQQRNSRCAAFSDYRAEQANNTSPSSDEEVYHNGGLIITNAIFVWAGGGSSL